MEGENKNRFFRYFYKGKQKKQQGKYQEACQFFQRAKSQWKQADKHAVLQCHINLLGVTEEIAQMYRRLGKFRQSEEFYYQAESLFKNFPSTEKFQQLEKDKATYLLLSNICLLCVDQADALQNPSENWKQFKKIIDISIQKILKAFSIVIKTLIQGKAQEQEAWWHQQYSATILNLINPIQLEADGFEDRKLYQLIIKLTEKIDIFYQSSPYKSSLRNNRSKSYYYRGVALKNLRRRSQAEKYLKKDYEYCEKQKNYQDKEKTRKILIQLLLEQQKYNEAKSYLTSQEQKREFYHIKKEKEEIAREMRELQKVGLENVERTIKCLEKAHSWKLYKLLIPFAFDLISLDKNNKLLFELNYYTAISYFQKDDFKVGYRYIMDALKYSKGNPLQFFQAKYLQLQYCEHIEQDQNIVFDLMNKCQQIAANISEDGVQTLIKERSYYIVHLQRKNRFSKFSLDHYDHKYFQKVAQSKEEKNKLKKQSLNILNLKSKEHQIYKPLPQQYLQECKINNIKPREHFFNLLRENKENSLNLSITFNLSEKQLLLLLNIFSITDLDFKNHHISTSFLEKLTEKISLQKITTFKLGNNVHNGLVDVIKKLFSLKVLVLKKVFSMRKSLFLNFLPHFNLLSLGLKYCKLEDQNLQDLKIGNFHSLIELNLKGNHLKGHKIGLLNNLKSLKKLNISQNPLTNLNFSLSQTFQKITIKRAHKLHQCQNFCLTRALTQTKILDLSENSSETILFILQNMIKYCYQFENLEFSHLQELYLKKSNLHSSLEQIFKQFLALGKKIRFIDARFSYVQETHSILKRHNSDKIIRIQPETMRAYQYS